MKTVIARRSFAPIFLVTAFAITAWTGPAAAQKSGGSITVGQELDIPGFDALKVGVYDTAALTASSAIFETLTHLDANGKPLQRHKWRRCSQVWELRLLRRSTEAKNGYSRHPLSRIQCGSC